MMNRHLVDRISSLPDCVLSVILSLLPTKEAISTVLLSKRWKLVWRTVHNLDFCHKDESCSEEDDMKFTEFVNQVLHLHGAGLLYKFSLKLDCCRFSSHTNSWINTAITKNVRELFLDGYDDESFLDLPVSVFRCGSLQSLKLVNTTVCVSDTLAVCLPRLESLKMDKVRFKSGGACEKLISGCPVLNNLHLDIDDSGIDLKCRISSASLRRLVMHFNPRCCLKLNAASLEYLHLGGHICEIIIEKSLSSLVEAHLDLTIDYPPGVEDEDEVTMPLLYNSIVKAIHAFDCAKVLTLIGETNKALESATISLPTEFKRLVKLVSTPCRSLQDFIHISDNLEVLEIYQDSNRYYHHSKWSTPVEVPRCLSNGLKKVELYYYECGEDECEMIRFMLEHGSKLEAVEIFCNKYWFNDRMEWVEEVLKVAQMILEYPRKSPYCKVRISKWCPYDD